MTEKKRGLGATVTPAGEAGKNLVTTWRRIETNNAQMPLKTALEKMNKALGTRYRHDKITSWEQAENGPSTTVINYMLKIVLEHSLKDFEISDSKIRDIVNSTQVAIKKS